jgi:hypothetical protein
MGMIRRGKPPPPPLPLLSLLFPKRKQANHQLKRVRVVLVMTVAEKRTCGKR